MNCPYCENKPVMIQRSAEDMVSLIVPPSHQLAKLAMAGVNRSRGKWYQCPQCRYVALFEKSPTEA